MCVARSNRYSTIANTHKQTHTHTLTHRDPLDSLWLANNQTLTGANIQLKITVRRLRKTSLAIGAFDLPNEFLHILFQHKQQ